jgi:hypothetical protein
MARRLIWPVLCTIAVSWVTSACAGELPKKFLGHWTNSDSGAQIMGIYVGARTYHEVGSNCDIRSIRPSGEGGESSGGSSYIIDMSCTQDGLDPPPRERVRRIWAMSTINDEEVLVMVEAAGSANPSIQIMQKGKD